MFKVEKILEVHTKKDGSHEFLIRWKGFKPSEDTWEPEAHLNCHELIEKFMKKVDQVCLYLFFIHNIYPSCHLFLTKL